MAVSCAVSARPIMHSNPVIKILIFIVETLII
jgi:hypothetical protein